MVPILGRPLLSYWLDLLTSSGVKEIIINTHYLPNVVLEFVEKSPWAGLITLVYEEELLGTGGTILKNEELLADGSFVVAHADNLTSFSFNEFVDSHRHRPVNTDMTMMLFRTDKPTQSGIVEIDEAGVVTQFHEKVENPPGNLANGAVYIFEPSILNEIKSFHKTVIDISTEIIPHKIGKINTYINNCYHRDIGDMVSLSKAEQEYSRIDLRNS